MDINPYKFYLIMYAAFRDVHRIRINNNVCTRNNSFTSRDKNKMAGDKLYKYIHCYRLYFSFLKIVIGILWEKSGNLSMRFAELNCMNNVDVYVYWHRMYVRLTAGYIDSLSL